MTEHETTTRSLLHRAPFVSLAHAGFFLIGIVNTLLGPILPSLSARWHLDDAHAGYLFVAQFAGCITGAAASSPLIKRMGFQPLLTYGFAGMGLALAGLTVSPWHSGIVCVYGLGLGLGLTIPSINLLIAEVNPDRRASALNVLNFLWGAGAVTGPPFISWLALGTDPARPLFSLAALLGCITLLLFQSVPTRSSRAEQSPVIAEASDSRAWISPYFLLTLLLLFIYTGTEMATGGWIPTFARRLDSSSHSWAVAQSLFWAGLLLGRAAAPLVLRCISSPRLVLSGILIAAAGLGSILTSGELTVLSAATFLAGLGMGPVFPTTFAIFTERLGTQAQRLTGSVFVLTSLGGAIMPWVVGFTSARYGGLRTGLIIPLIGALAMIVLQVTIINVLARRRNP
jgi:FHS family glucose/mannose:H+ symporter-like MFS transporter